MNPLAAAAREALGDETFAYFASGAGDTPAANEAAWARVTLRPRVLRDVSTVDTSATVLDERLAAPILAAPVALLRLAHPDGEAAWAAGVAAAGALPVLSTRSTTPIADVAAAVGGAPWWFQVYVMRDRTLTAELVRRAAAAGARALVLTGDAPRLSRRAPVRVPPGAWMPDLGVHDEERTRQDPATTFADVGWLREVSGGLPVLVKGVLRAADASLCVDAGAAGLVVSNHGGRQLEGAAPTAEALPEVATHAGRFTDVYADGGIRTGIDVLRARALGAQAVLVGRPLVWALATGGADGVRAHLEHLRAGLEEAMALAGAATVDDIGPDLVS